MALQVFKEVPGFDPRTLVLQKEEEFLDLQFCSCVNKYKRRFSQFLQENENFYSRVKNTAVSMAARGYKDVDVRDLLDYVRVDAKMDVDADKYLTEHAHDFQLDVLPRAYLVRKLMMEEPKLFGFFKLAPVKCKSDCGYPA